MKLSDYVAGARACCISEHYASSTIGRSTSLYVSPNLEDMYPFLDERELMDNVILE
jgi:hypothetical protein